VPAVFQDSFEVFKDELLRKLPPPPQVAEVNSRKQKLYEPLICVSYRGKDEDLALAIKSYLKERRFEFQGDRDKELSFFAMIAGLSDGVLILYDNAEEDWVNTRVLMTRGKVNERARRPLSAGAIYESPPEDRVRVNIDIGGWMFIDCRKGHSLEQLDPFLHKVRSGN
jgi:hypothetical protein